MERTRMWLCVYYQAAGHSDFAYMYCKFLYRIAKCFTLKNVTDLYAAVQENSRNDYNQLFISLKSTLISAWNDGAPLKCMHTANSISVKSINRIDTIRPSVQLFHDYSLEKTITHLISNTNHLRKSIHRSDLGLNFTMIWPWHWFDLDLDIWPWP